MVKNLSANRGDTAVPWVGKMPWRRKRQPVLVFLPGKAHGQRSMEGYRPQCCKELDMTKQLSAVQQHKSSQRLHNKHAQEQ